MIYYTIMPDGTVKQLNPFTGTEVWAVAGRRGKPLENETQQTAKPLEVHNPEDYCSFCSPRYFETAPEKSRLIRRNGVWERIDLLAPDRYFDSVAEFRRTGNMFEIVTLDYWRKNYAYKMPASRVKWREDYLAVPTGLKHISDIVQYKLRREGKTEDQIEKMPMAEKLAVADAFFGGGHEMIIARRHYKDGATLETDLYSSGEMTEEEHYWYFKLAIDAIRDITLNNRYVRYISCQNWLRNAGASLTICTQPMSLDEWGLHRTRSGCCATTLNVYNEYGVNFAAHHNLRLRKTTSRSPRHRPPVSDHRAHSRSPAEGCTRYSTRDPRRQQHGPCHSCQIPNENGTTPIDAVYKMPWHCWRRVTVPAGFEGELYLHQPHDTNRSADKMVPRLTS
jgi:hypothetical protein